MIAHEQRLLFDNVSDAELRQMYIENGCYKPGYCYDPEVKWEFKRRRRERIREARKLKNIYKGVNRGTSEINRHFRIKISGVRDGVKYNKLVGVSGLINIIGVDLANKFIERAFNSLQDKEVCKLRTGLKITFYSK